MDGRDGRVSGTGRLGEGSLVAGSCHQLLTPTVTLAREHRLSQERASTPIASMCVEHALSKLSSQSPAIAGSRARPHGLRVRFGGDTKYADEAAGRLQA
eukprot:scaffold9007_cov112-Isochrysis_galbana.AAC.3